MPFTTTAIEGPAGRRAVVTGPLSMGWDAVVFFPDGMRYRSPRYYASKASAKAWAIREMNVGIHK